MRTDLLELLRVDQLPSRESVTRPLKELVDLTGTRTAVTGGHGPNLGQAIVDRLAGAGASVAIVHRPHAVERAQAKAAEVAERHGVDVVAVEGDMSDWDSAHRAAEQVAEKLGGLDVWVNSAGAGRDPAMENTGEEMIGAQTFWQVPQRAIDSTVTALLTTMLYGTHAALNVMVPQHRGRIINIASAAAFNPIKGQVPYSVMKAAVASFTELLASEIGPDGVTIAAVAPGILLSEANLEEYALPCREEDYETMRKVFERMTIGRCSWPEEAANMVAFLASDAGAFVHGTTVRVSGGF
jgi:3-oxoacyl-[acyl-carrier protein] reductase